MSLKGIKVDREELEFSGMIASIATEGLRKGAEIHNNAEFLRRWLRAEIDEASKKRRAARHGGNAPKGDCECWKNQRQKQYRYH